MRIKLVFKAVGTDVIPASGVLLVCTDVLEINPGQRKKGIHPKCMSEVASWDKPRPAFRWYSSYLHAKLVIDPLSHHWKAPLLIYSLLLGPMVWVISTKDPVKSPEEAIDIKECQFQGILNFQSLYLFHARALGS